MRVCVFSKEPTSNIKENNKKQNKNYYFLNAQNKKFKNKTERKERKEILRVLLFWLFNKHETIKFNHHKLTVHLRTRKFNRSPKNSWKASNVNISKNLECGLQKNSRTKF